MGAAAALLATGLASSPAQAGAPESLESLAQHPNDPNRLVLHYDDGYGGVLSSSDGGKTFEILPGLAFTKSGLYRDHPALRVLGDGKLVIGAPWDGLFVSSDAEGCIKPQDLIQPGSISDLALHPTDSGVVFAVGSKGQGDKVQRGLFKRDAAGTVTQLGADDGATFSPEGLAVLTREASAEKLRFVEVGLKADASPALRVSDDLGQTWVEQLIPVPDAAGGTPRLVAVKGVEPLEVVVSLFREGSPDPFDPILYSTDGGANFTVYPVQIGKTGQALIAPDGKVYLADMGTSTTDGGLWVASDIGEPLTKIADYSVRCLGYDKGSEQLYLCKQYELGHFDPVSHAYCRMYQLNETADMLCDLSTFPKFSESDSRTVAQTVQELQLCNAWCGASHYASSPFCAMYNVASPTCGLAARAYDRAGGASGAWIEPPGSDEPRCAGFEPPAADAGVGDAGVTPDAGQQHEAADAGATDGDDAAVAPAKKKKDDGCSLGSQAGSAPLWLGVLGMLLALRIRRRQRG